MLNSNTTDHTFNGRLVSDKHHDKFPTCSKCGMSTCMHNYLIYLRTNPTSKENHDA
jgi:hypothetical protein